MNKSSFINSSTLSTALVLIVVFWNWWFPGPRVANDYPDTSQETLNSLMDLPRAWSTKYSEGMGEYSVFTLWAWPISFLSGLLANIGLNFELIERIVFILPFILIGTFGIWRFLERLNLSNLSKIVASLFYLLDTYILLVIDGGQLMIALAYAWFPIAYLAVTDSLNSGLYKRILAGLSIWILGFLDIRFVYVLLVLLIINFLYELVFVSKKEVINIITEWVKIGLLTGVIVAILNAYWIIPILIYPVSLDDYERLTQASFSNFYNLGHSLLLLSPHWYENIFGKITPLRWEFIFIPFLAFLAPLLRRNDKLTGLWTVVALISIFLTKGFSPPFLQVYQWLYNNMPGFTLFRDSTKFFFLIGLSYSALIGIAVNEILKRIRLNKIKLAIFLSIILYILFLIRPVWLGQMTGTFSRYNGNEYSQVKNLLQNDNDFSRVLWIPATIPLTYANPVHPIVEARRIFSIRPFASGVVGSYENFNFLREAPFIGEIFDIMGVGYIVYSFEDAKRADDGFIYYHIFSEQLSNLSWLTKIQNLNISIFKIKQNQDKFFITSNLWAVIGSDEILNESTKSASLSLKNNALVFVQNDPQLMSKLIAAPFLKIVLYEKDLIDLSASLIPEDKLYFPSNDLTLSPDQNGWWKRESSEFLWWRNFINQKYKLDSQDYYLNRGLAISEGNNEFVVPRNRLSEGNILLARLMVSPKSGAISFYQGDKKIEEINTKMDQGTRYIKLTGYKDVPDRIFEYDKANFKWFVIGEIKNLPLKIKTSGELNTINALSVIRSDEWNQYEKTAEEINSLGRIKTYEEQNIDFSKGKISFEQIDPTKYRIEVKELDKPAVLIFTQKYDPKWMLNNKPPFLVYNLLNGFVVENGEYILEYKPQKYVNLGFIISSATLLIILFLIFKLKNKYNRTNG